MDGIEFKKEESVLTPRYQLATKIYGKSKIHEKALRPIFQRALFQLLEGHTATNLALQEKIWKTVSRSRLIILQKTIISQIAEKSLMEFSENEIESLLKSYKDNIPNQFLQNRLKKAMHATEETLAKTLYEKASSMKEEIEDQIQILLEVNKSRL